MDFVSIKVGVEEDIFCIVPGRFCVEDGIEGTAAATEARLKADSFFAFCFKSMIGGGTALDDFAGNFMFSTLLLDLSVFVFDLTLSFRCTCVAVAMASVRVVDTTLSPPGLLTRSTMPIRCFRNSVHHSLAKHRSTRRLVVGLISRILPLLRRDSRVCTI